MIYAKLAAGAVALACSTISPARGEPATADPAFAPSDYGVGTGARLAVFTLAGTAFSVDARGRRAMVDTNIEADALEDAQAMSKSMPGYPQPAHVTVDFRVWF